MAQIISQKNVQANRGQEDMTGKLRDYAGLVFSYELGRPTLSLRLVTSRNS